MDVNCYDQKLKKKLNNSKRKIKQYEEKICQMVDTQYDKAA